MLLFFSSKRSLLTLEPKQEVHFQLSSINFYIFDISSFAQNPG